LCASEGAAKLFRIIRVLYTLNDSMADIYFVPLELATRCSKLHTQNYMDREFGLYPVTIVV